jgi:ribose/xylose/arabinose/galactoside ABC-type transport system permease subunit
MSTTIKSSSRADNSGILNFGRENAILVAFAAVLLVLALTRQQFLTVENLTNILQQNAIIGVIACGMTFAIIIGGFDLSVGAAAALAAIICASVMASGVPLAIPLGLGAGVVAGLVTGAINGWLVAYLRVNPFVATLGTMTIIRGLVYVFTNATPIFGVPYEITNLGLGKVVGIPVVTIVFAVVAVALGALLHGTRFGHYVYTVGGNARAAAMMGIDIRRTRFLTYLLVSVCAAIAGMLLVGQTASGQPQAAIGYELTAIAAVIVGGASLGGGRGRMIDTVLGVLLLGVVANALNLFGVSPFWQPVATGMILIAAVALDRKSAD